MTPPLSPPTPLDTQLLALAELAFKLGGTNRATRYPDATTRESVTDHTVMLALVAPVLATWWNELRPSHSRLGTNYVMAFAVIHDVLEAQTGDFDTIFGLTPEQKEARDKAEQEARRAFRDFCTATPAMPLFDLLDIYERQEVREARFVRLVDKLLPKLTQALSGCRGLRAAGVSRGRLKEAHDRQIEHLTEQYPDFHPLILLLLKPLCRWTEGLLDEEPSVPEAEPTPLPVSSTPMAGLLQDWFSTLPLEAAKAATEDPPEAAEDSTNVSFTGIDLTGRTLALTDPESFLGKWKADADEAVDHPAHYGGAENPYEAIKVIEAWGLDFCLGNAVKYISRAGKKDPAKEIEDLEKAAWYLNRRIQQLRGA